MHSTDFFSSTIQRCPHDKENPYSMVSNQLIRDNSISPECRWLLIYLLTNKDNWIISTSQIVNYLKPHKGYGRDSVRKLIGEAVAAGYMRRDEYIDEQNMKRYRYFLSESRSFSNNFSDELIPRAPGARAPKTRGLNKEHSSPKGEEKKEQYEEGSISSLPSADASSLYEFFLSKIKERNPGFKEPNRGKWLKEIELMLKLDNRGVKMTMDLITWASTHKWWKTACLSASKLRSAYDEMLMQMESEKEKNLIQSNRSYALSLKQEYPKQMAALSFDEKFARNLKAGKEIPFNLPKDVFEEALIGMFGGKRE